MKKRMNSGARVFVVGLSQSTVLSDCLHSPRKQEIVPCTYSRSINYDIRVHTYSSSMIEPYVVMLYNEPIRPTATT